MTCTQPNYDNILYYIILFIRTYISFDMQKHNITTFTNNKKGQYKLYNIDAVKTNQLKKQLMCNIDG